MHHHRASGKSIERKIPGGSRRFRKDYRKEGSRRFPAFPEVSMCGRCPE